MVVSEELGLWILWIVWVRVWSSVILRWGTLLGGHCVIVMCVWVLRRREGGSEVCESVCDTNVIISKLDVRVVRNPIVNVLSVLVV